MQVFPTRNQPSQATMNLLNPVPVHREAQLINPKDHFTSLPDLLQIWKENARSSQFHKNPVLKDFLSSYHSTLNTKKCYQCHDCTKRIGFKQAHPRLTRIFDRKDQNGFPENIQIAIKSYQGIMFKPCSQITEEFDHHCQGLINDGEVMAVSQLSSSFKSFFIEVILQTNEF